MRAKQKNTPRRFLIPNLPTLPSSKRRAAPPLWREAALGGGSPTSLLSKMSYSLFQSFLWFTISCRRGGTPLPPPVRRRAVLPLPVLAGRPREDAGSSPALGGGAPAAKICIPVQRPYGLGAPHKESASR